MFFFTHLQAQSRVDGRIVDKLSSQPLVGVNVFFSKTTLGSTTDDNGFYSINNIPAGQYELVVSMIGYEIEREDMIVHNEEKFTINFRLNQQTIRMSEINVTANTDKAWKKNYGIFKRKFLGTTKNGEACTILNEFVLSFSKSDKIFRAQASQPLQIENPGLGYKITYLLDNFEIEDQEVRYSGDLFFEEANTSSKRQKSKWKKNRQKAFKGSLRHFLFTINERYHLRFQVANGLATERKSWKKISGRSKDPLVREGFEIFFNKKDLFGSSMIVPSEFKPLKNEVLVYPGQNESEPLLSFEGRMMIIYIKESPELTYMMENDSPATYKQTSYLLLRADSVYFDKSGRYFEPFMIEQQGYSSWERVGDQLPFDYTHKNN